MNHTADIAQKYQTQEVEHEKSGQGVAHVPPGEGTRSLWVLGELLTHKVPSHRTGGAYSLFKATAHPGAGPPPHVHHREDEAFYVLEGEYEFLVDGHIFKAEAGSLIYVAKGALHAHKNVGEGIGRMLLTQTPGGLYELFFEKAGRPASADDGDPPAVEDPPDIGRWIVEVAAEHGTEIPPSLVD
jgi:mannose-6-phosphate isomerase-like protein (cupin superfamily)